MAADPISPQSKLNKNDFSNPCVVIEVNMGSGISGIIERTDVFQISLKKLDSNKNDKYHHQDGSRKYFSSYYY